MNLCRLSHLPYESLVSAFEQARQELHDVRRLDPLCC